MATRKTSTQKVDPVSIAALAMRHVRNVTAYNRIVAANSSEVIAAAWSQLSPVDQDWITKICNESPEPDISAIADEIVNCGTYLELQAIKSEYGESIVKQAWLTIPIPERTRIKALCDNVQKVEEPTPMTELPATYHVEPAKSRTLFGISHDLEKLNDLLDESNDDAEQQQLIAQWFETLGDERDRKLDGYAALITEMLARAEVRKAEAKRLTELAASDENRAKLLRDRLKWFFQAHNLKSINTARYRLLVATNGGKQPLIIDESVPVTQLPEQFQRVSIDPDTAAIRDALERGEKLGFAQLAERGTSLRIK